MNIYQQQILDNYHNPVNFGKPTSYTHTSKKQNLSCGDEIEIYLTIQDGKVVDMHYEAEGCAISVASASLLSQYIVGKTLEEVKKMGIEEIKEILGIELTPSRNKCALLALQAVQASITQ